MNILSIPFFGIPGFIVQKISDKSQQLNREENMIAYQKDAQLAAQEAAVQDLADEKTKKQQETKAVLLKLLPYIIVLGIIIVAGSSYLILRKKKK